MERAFKTKLNLNNRERSILARYCGAARFVYNWALADRKAAYEKDGTKVRYNDQKVRFNALKRTAYPWIVEIPYVVTEYAFRDLDTAFKNFFRRVRQGAEEAGYPRFKRRGDSRQSCSFGTAQIEQDRIRLPIIGWLRLAEHGYLPVGRHTGRVTVSVHAGDWYVSVQTDSPLPVQPERTAATLGVDLGHGVLATLSDGTTYANIRPLARLEQRLQRLDRELKRRRRGGANYEKTRRKRAKLHAKIARQREHHLHETSRQIVDKRAQVLVVEGYHVRDLMEHTPSTDRKHKRSNFKMADAAVGELRRQLLYKQEWAGGVAVKGDRYAPTNRQHCECGHVNEVVPLVEWFTCAGCGATVQRRLNSANVVLEQIC